MSGPLSGKVNLLGLPKAKLAELLGLMGEKPYRAEQILKWIHQRNVDDFESMTDISKALRAKLAEIAEIREPEVVMDKISVDGTRKWLIKTISGSSVEMVFIPEESRGTLCVSTQAGCMLDCKFCSTGKQGFNSNLKAWEIISQLRIAKREMEKVYPDRERAITNVVMMGMGEPLFNCANVFDALNLMMDDLAYGLSKRRVTLSTSGVVPGIYEMAGITDASLAISLHAPDDELRNQLVPINKKYPIRELLDACRHYLATLGEKRTITVEYILLKGVNDQPGHAVELARVLDGFPCKINLIPFNPFPGSGYQRPSSISVRAFQDRLIQKGYSATVRTTRGEDIQAACGQLVGEVNDKTRRKERYILRQREAERYAADQQNLTIR
jgi:23S rRNA (adenine2503-C2)-methyltransferase